MPIRYSDFKKRSEKSADFVVRKYDPSFVKLILLFFVALATGTGWELHKMREGSDD